MKKNILSILLSLFLVQPAFAQSKAWDRLHTFGKGMNLSWLENYWNGSASNGYMDYLDLNTIAGRQQDLELMKEMRIQTLRLPVCFDVWEDSAYPYDFDMPHYFEAIDSILAWGLALDFNILIEYHHGSLTENNFEEETERVIAIWKQIIARYGNYNPEKVFFELYNEPNELSFDIWQEIVETIVDSIRIFDGDQTIIVGGGDWNSIYGLTNLVPLDDDNIIYTFHFYEPFLFTHQGAEWMGVPMATTGIPYPFEGDAMPSLNPASRNTWGENAYNDYSSDGNTDTLQAWIADAKLWSEVNKQPVFCGEFGSYYKGADDSRCRYTKAIRTAMECNDIPYCYWEWDQGFGIFDGPPSMSNLSFCMMDAWGLLASDTLENGMYTDFPCRIYPNPTEEIIFIERTDLDVPMIVNIYDSNARLLWGQALCVGMNEIDVNALTPGIYFLQFLNMKGDRLFASSLIKR